MGDYDRLRGLSGQSLGGPKARQVEVAQYVASGTYTFVAPVNGYYKFVLWGAGGGGGNGTPANGGGSGAYCEYTRAMGASERATVVVPPAVGKATNGAAATVTFLDGKAVTAGGGLSNTAGGTASGGDVNLNGSSGGLSSGSNNGGTGLGTGGGAGGTGDGGTIGGGGGGAPANSPYTGGQGGSAATTSIGLGVGAGAGAGTSSTSGQGAALVQCLRPLS